LFLQWPVGSWISEKGRLYGLKFSLINFSFASFLLFISSYLNISAFYLISFSLILVSLGTASFLPTSTDVVFRIAPSNKKVLHLLYYHNVSLWVIFWDHFFRDEY